VLKQHITSVVFRSTCSYTEGLQYTEEHSWNIKIKINDCFQLLMVLCLLRVHIDCFPGTQSIYRFTVHVNSSLELVFTSSANVQLGNTSSTSKVSNNVNECTEWRNDN